MFHLSRDRAKFPLILGSIFSFYAFSLSSYAFAEAPSDLPDIHISASKKQVVEETYHSAQIILLENITPLELSVSELLAKEPGINLRRLGDRGAYATLSMRGFGGNNVQIFLDNIPLTNTSLGQPDLSLYSLNDFERIEIYRSDSPASFNQALGGVIHLKTKAKKQNRTQVRFSIGDFATGEVHLSQSKRVLGIDTTLEASVQKSAGNFTYYNDRATLYNKSDDLRQKRINNHYDLFSYGLNMKDRSYSSNLSLHHRGRIRSQGVPGPGTVQAQSTSAEEQEFTQRITYGKINLFEKKIELSLAADYLHTNRDFSDPGKEVSLGLSQMNTKVEQWGLDSSLRYRLNTSNMLTLAPRLNKRVYLQKQNDESSGTVKLSHDESSLYLGSSYQYTMTPNHQLKLHLRHTLSSYQTKGASTESETFNQTSPALSLVASHQNMSWGLNLGQYHRFPTLLEFYGDGGKTAVANLSLKPESGYNFDIGCKFKLSEYGELSIHGYASESQNMILVLQNSQYTLRAENIGRNKIYGAELAKSFTIKPIKLNLAYTYLMAKDESEVLGFHNNQLPGMSPHNAQVKITYKKPSIEFYIENDFRSSAYLDRANQRPIPQRFFQHVGMQTDFNKSPWRFALIIHNILNKNVEQVNLPDQIEQKATASIVDYMGYPLPGRLLKINLIWTAP